ncbi:MAG: hypothetical protein Q9213_006043 [Squamulea squamosa]
MFEFFFSQPNPKGEIVPLSSDLQSACLASSPTDIQRLIIRQEQYLLDSSAQNPNIKVAMFYLSRLHPSTLYQGSDTLRRRPDSFTPAQYLLERAACHGNAALVRHLLATYPDLDLKSQTLGLNALTGGIEIWKALVEKEPDLKNMHYGHSGSVVEKCVFYDHPEILRFLLEQGAKVEDEGRPILHIAEIRESSEEIRGMVIESQTVPPSTIWPASLLISAAFVHGKGASPINSTSTVLTGDTTPSQSYAVPIPNCIQPGLADDPPGTEISAALKPAVLSACDISYQQQVQSGDGPKPLMSFQAGQMFFNTTNHAACSGSGGGFSDDPVTSGWAENGPDYTTPIWNQFMSMQAARSNYYQYKGSIVSGNPMSSSTGLSAAPGSSATATEASSTTASDVSSTGPTQPKPTESSPLCVPFQDPHEGINACNCESSAVTTRLSMRVGSSNVCGYTTLPPKSPTAAPSTTSAPEWPFTFTDINKGPVIACQNSTVGKAGGIKYTECKGDKTTVGTDTKIAARYSSFVASASSAAALPTAVCSIYNSGFAYHLLIKHINGWAGENGGKLRHEDKGCGALTSWKWYHDSAEFYLPFFINKGCVERAIKSAGGPHLSCRDGGIGKQVAVAGSLQLWYYKKRQELADDDCTQTIRQMDDQQFRYEEEMASKHYQERQALAGAEHKQAIRQMNEDKLRQYDKKMMADPHQR